MRIIDADKFLSYLIFSSKHIDGLTCGELKEAIELCNIDVLDKIRAEIESIELLAEYTRGDIKRKALEIIDKYMSESEV